MFGHAPDSYRGRADPGPRAAASGADPFPAKGRHARTKPELPPPLVDEVNPRQGHVCPVEGRDRRPFELLADARERLLGGLGDALDGGVGDAPAGAERRVQAHVSGGKTALATRQDIDTPEGAVPGPEAEEHGIRSRVIPADQGDGDRVRRSLGRVVLRLVVGDVDLTIRNGVGGGCSRCGLALDGELRLAQRIARNAAGARPPREKAKGGKDDCSHGSRMRCTGRTRPRMRFASPDGAMQHGPTHVPEPEEHERRVALADVLESRCEEIVSRWLERIQTEHVVPDVEESQLRDAIPDYLRHLASALRSGESLERSGTASWRDVAREHALTRVRLGFDIEQLVCEFVALRRVLSSVIAEKGLDPDMRQSARVADLIEAAIAVAVRSYVDARDYAARQREAERIAFITHELRSPLTAVKLAAGRLQWALSQTTEQKRIFEVLDRNVDRLTSLVDSVLAAERLESGKVQAHLVETSLGELLEPCVAAASLAAAEKGLVFRQQYDPGLLVCADGELAGSALRNVLDNALKYTDEGTVSLVAEPRPDRVILHVWDSCGGLSEQELNVIFEPFERCSRNKPGSGLGLAIARRALQAQGGEIGAESPGDRGCHFWIALPRPTH